MKFKKKTLQLFFIQCILCITLYSCKDDTPETTSPIYGLRIETPVLNIPCHLSCEIENDATAEWYIDGNHVSNEKVYYHKFTEEGSFLVECKSLYKGKEFSMEQTVTVYEPGVIIGDYETLHQHYPYHAVTNGNKVYIGLLETSGEHNITNHKIVSLDITNGNLELADISPLEFSNINSRIKGMFTYNNSIYLFLSNFTSSMNVFNLNLNSAPAEVFTLTSAYETILHKNDSVYYFMVGSGSAFTVGKGKVGSNILNYSSVELSSIELLNIKAANSADGGFIVSGTLSDTEPVQNVIIKTDAAFNIDWHQIISGYQNLPIFTIFTDNSENTLVLYGSSDKEVLIKYDKTGNQIWKNQYTEIYGGATSGAICETSDGYIFSGGHHSGNKTVIHKVDKDGYELWAKEFYKGEVAEILPVAYNEFVVVKRDGKDVMDKVYNDVFFPDDNFFGEGEGFYNISFISVFKLDTDGNVVDFN